MIEPSYSFVPRYLSVISAATGHIPFCYDLVRLLRPSLLVELGTWNVDSFFAFCQSVADFSLNKHAVLTGQTIGKETIRPDNRLRRSLTVFKPIALPPMPSLPI